MDEKPPGFVTVNGLEYLTMSNGEFIALFPAPVAPRDNSEKKGATLDSTQTVLKIGTTWMYRNSACMRHPHRIAQTGEDAIDLIKEFCLPVNS
jgi:hypothetical protein